MAAQRTILNIGNFLSQDGIYRSVIEDLSDQLEAAGWQVLRASNKRHKIARLIDMLLTIWVKRNQYRVAHMNVFSGLAFIWAEAAGYLLRLMGKPFVLSLHGGNLPNFARRWPKRVGSLLRAADVVVAPSQFMMAEFRKYRSDLVLIPNGIDISRFPFLARIQPEPVLVWVRAFHQIYNPAMAPRVLAGIREQFPQAKLIMVGPDTDDGSRDETQLAAAQLGVEQFIHFTGGIPAKDIPANLQMGDIFLNTTNIDNTPVSVLEAMACGLCVVSTDVGGIPYLLAHEEDALLVPMNDRAAMAAAVRQILSEASLANRLSHNARSTAEKFGWGKILPEWDRLLLEVASQSKHD
jgi:glycosyltransferase involved in cell wall biosynthesis